MAITKAKIDSRDGWRGAQSRGFSLVEVLTVVSVIAIVASVAVSFVSDIKASTEEAKLESDLKVLNSTVGAYLAFGGNFDGKESLDQVIAKLKSRASSATEDQVVGLRAIFSIRGSNPSCRRTRKPAVIVIEFIGMAPSRNSNQSRPVRRASRNSD